MSKKTSIAIYLAGSIKKGHEKIEDSYWTEEDISYLRKCLHGFEVSFLNPAFRSDDLSDSYSVFGRDMLQVFTSHYVFIDARHRRGLGVGAEMMWAKVNKIPVIIWAPRNSHYRMDQTTLLGVSVNNFVHPFVEALSDKIVDTLSEGADWIRTTFANPNAKIKGIEEICASMQYYREKQLAFDEPMQNLLIVNEELKKRMHRNDPHVEVGV